MIYKLCTTLTCRLISISSRALYSFVPKRSSSFLGKETRMKGDSSLQVWHHSGPIPSALLLRSKSGVSCHSAMMESENSHRNTSPKRTLLSRSSSEYAAPSIQLAWEEKTHFVTALLLLLTHRAAAQRRKWFTDIRQRAKLSWQRTTGTVWLRDGEERGGRWGGEGWPWHAAASVRHGEAACWMWNLHTSTNLLSDQRKVFLLHRGHDAACSIMFHF